MAAISGRLSIGEEAYLRALTGRLVGIGLFKGFNKVAVVPYPDRICESVAAASIVAYLDAYGYGPGKAMVFDYAQGSMTDVAKKIVDWGAEAVYLAFGGEQRLSDVNNMVIETLKALKTAGFKGALLIHVRAWLATKQFSTVVQDPELRSYLAGLKEVRLFTADANAKKFFFHIVKVGEDGSITLSKYMEVDITDEHANLLKLSLPPT